MAYKKVEFKTNPAFMFDTVGTVFEGTILSRKSVNSKKFKSGVGNFIDAVDMDGVEWSLLAPNYLWALLKGIKDGARVRITFLGTAQKPEEKGGGTYNDFLVEEDDEAHATKKPATAAK